MTKRVFIKNFGCQMNARDSEVICGLLKKEGFKFIFQEGERRNIYLCNGGFNFLLVIIFDKAVALGLIRIFANKTVDSLKLVLENAVEAEDKTSEFLDVEFGELLGQELDKSFNL